MLPRLLTLAALLAAPAVSAQSLPSWAAPPEAESSAPGGPPGPPSPSIAQETPTVPVDGGLGLLALAGAGYAARRLRRRSE